MQSWPRPLSPFNASLVDPSWDFSDPTGSLFQPIPYEHEYLGVSDPFLGVPVSGSSSASLNLAESAWTSAPAAPTASNSAYTLAPMHSLSLPQDLNPSGNCISQTMPAPNASPSAEPPSTPSSSALSSNKVSKRRKAAVSNSSVDPVFEKRQRNTLAARKSRQKRLDRISELERALQEMTRERDELKLKLARQEACTDELRQLLNRKT